MDIKYEDLFRNRTYIPPKGTSEYNTLVNLEVERCIGGVTLDGIFISGWLYWHLNHWWIRGDGKDEWDNDIRIVQLPDLRDNEWVRADALEQCRVQKKGYMEIGLRQGGKSELEASYLAYNAILFKDTQNVIVGGNDNDLNLLKDKVDFGLKRLWAGIAIPRLDKTWRGSAIRLGRKLKNGDDEVWSSIIIRNAADGKNTETAAGTTAKSYIMDEVGKYPFASAFAAAVPALNSKYGWRAIPILVGTGGSFDKGENAERFFYNPTANNFLAFRNPETNRETCLFMSGLYRWDCKEEMGLGDFLVKEGKIEKATEEQNKLKISVRNEEKALAKILEERETKKKDPDQTEYLKAIMYHPLTEDECFLTASNNIFNTRAAKAQQSRLYENEITGSYVFLSYDGEKVIHTFVDKKPISQFPHKPIDDLDAPIIMWEPPMHNPPFGLYVAGVDPYRHANSAYSNSLGVVYILKRMHDITGEKFQDAIVACYAARPDDKDKWNEQARLLIKYYNARTLCENDEMSFIEYMKAVGDAQYLEKQPSWLKEIVPTTQVKREFGIHRSSERIIEHLHGCLKTYLNQKLYVEKDDLGIVTKEITGVYQVRDPVLLEEIIKFNENDNFDRIVAAELAIAMAMHLDPISKVSSIDTDTRFKSYFNKDKTNMDMFGRDVKLFPNIRNNKIFS